MKIELPDVFRIAEWRIECNQNLAWQGDLKVRIEPKAMMILQYLAARPGQVVSRNELFKEFWPNQVVTEDALTRIMSNLRRTFKDNSNHPKFIATVRMVGYKLVAPVTVLNSPQKNSINIGENDDKLLPQIHTSENQQAEHKNLSIYSLTKSNYIKFIAILIVGIAVYFSTLNSPVEPAFTRLTYEKPQDIMPSFSSDGSKLTFINTELGKKHTLLIRNLVINNYQPIGLKSLNYYFPVFSPDGKEIAALTQNQSTEHKSLSIVNIANNSHRQLLTLDSLSLGLSWHPQTKVIAFTQPHIDQKNHGIYIWNNQSKKQTLITQSILGVEDSNPIFSPSGNQLAFIRSSAYKESALFITDLSGQSKQISPYLSNIYSFDWLDENTLLISNDKGIVSYSMDGENKLIVAQQDNNPYQSIRINRIKNELLVGLKNEHHEGHVTDMTNNLTSLAVTRSQANDVEISISADAKHLAFVSNRTGEKTLWYRIHDSFKIESIKNTDFDEIFDLVWSPDSTIVAAVIKKGQQYGILNYSVVKDQTTLFWQSSAPINLSGWKTNKLLVFSQLNEIDKSQRWMLKQLKISNKELTNLSNVDIFQARLSPDKSKLIFINSSRKGLWSWDWHSRPNEIINSTDLSLNRSWDIDEQNIYGVNLSGKIFKFDYHTGQKSIINKPVTFAHEYRAQKLINSLAATKRSFSEGDFWITSL